MKTRLLIIIPIVAMSLVGITIFGLAAMSSGFDHNVTDVAPVDEPTCKNQIHDNKPPTIYNVTPTSDGAIVRWYQSPQTVNEMNCGFPVNYRIYTSLNSPVVSTFAYSDDVIPGGIRGSYEITGLESKTTYHVFVQADWDQAVSTSSADVAFTTLSPDANGIANNPVERLKDEMSNHYKNNLTVLGGFSTYDNKNLAFKIKYPKGFDLTETLNDTSFKIRDPDTRHVIVGISDKITFSSDSTKFFKSSDVPFSYRIRVHETTDTMEGTKEILLSKDSPVLLEVVKLGGREALAGTIGNQSDFHDGYTVGTIHDGKLYGIFFMYPKGQIDKYQSTIDYVIDSFEFVKQSNQNED